MPAKTLVNLCLELSHVVACRIQSHGMTWYDVRCNFWEPRLTLVSMATKALVGVVKLTPDVFCQFRKGKPNRK